jgi:hypothetical protein
MKHRKIARNVFEEARNIARTVCTTAASERSRKQRTWTAPAGDGLSGRLARRKLPQGDWLAGRARHLDRVGFKQERYQATHNH